MIIISLVILCTSASSARQVRVPKTMRPLAQLPTRLIGVLLGPHFASILEDGLETVLVGASLVLTLFALFG